MNNYFFKCDISGIQSFIFNVPSDGAAKELKNRSMYVQDISEKCLQAFEDYFGKDNTKEFYKGGGNFYLKIETEKTEEELFDFKETVNKKYRLQDIFPYIDFVKDEGQESINDLLDKINKKIQKTKHQRPIEYKEFFFEPIEFKININEIKGINGQVPKDKHNNILDFDEIAKRSEGDKKLAALKLDVDNLGKLFRDRTENDYKKLSDALKDFFDAKFLQLIEQLEMKDHIYVVFSGGDDCFLIGCWNKIFALAIELRQKFDEFQKDLKIQIPSLPQEEITFSAGIVVVSPKYPVMRLAEEVEEVLESSKKVENKNSVNVFGKTLSWKEFEQSQAISKQLFDLIDKKGESKSLVARIKSSDIGFDKLQQKALNGKISLPKVWRLKYYLRNVKKENEPEVGKLFEEYTKAVLKALMQGKNTSPDIYPVAARWAELLLKQNENL